MLKSFKFGVINVQFKENNKIFKGFNSLKNDKFKLIYSKYSRD